VLRIAIINLTGGGISGGYKKYLKNILPRMSRHHEVESILCASPKSLDVSSWFEGLNNVIFVDCKPFNIFGKKDSYLVRRLDEFHPDVIFIPTERGFQYRQVPTVCMLQNMLPMAKIKHYNMHEKIRKNIQKIIARKALKEAQRVIAISGFVKNFIQSEWQIPEDKISIIYHGVSLPQDKELIIPAAVPVQWEGKFIFTAGSIEPYRGLEDIIFALKRLRQDKRDIKVLVAGTSPPSMMSYYKKLQGVVDQLGLQENICWAGMLNEQEMAWCYNNAQAYIMSSRVEACPNTALEAMLYGNIIISSAEPPMPEFFGKYAMYYEVGDIEKLADYMFDAVHFPSTQRDSLSQAVKRRALDFSWEDTVSKTMIEFKIATLVPVNRHF